MKRRLNESEIDRIISESIESYMLDEGVWDKIKGAGRSIAGFGQNIADLFNDSSSDGGKTTRKGTWAFKYYVTTAFVYGKLFMNAVNQYCESQQLENNSANFDPDNLEKLCNNMITMYNNFSKDNVKGDPQECVDTMSKLLSNCKKWRNYIMKLPQKQAQDQTQQPQQKQQAQDQTQQQQKQQTSYFSPYTPQGTTGQSSYGPPEMHYESLRMNGKNFKKLFESLQMSGKNFKKLQELYANFYNNMSKALQMFRNKFGVEEKYDYWSDSDSEGNSEEQKQPNEKNKEWWNTLDDNQKSNANKFLASCNPNQRNLFMSTMSKMFPKGGDNNY